MGMTAPGRKVRWLIIRLVSEQRFQTHLIKIASLRSVVLYEPYLVLALFYPPYLFFPISPSLFYLLAAFRSTLTAFDGTAHKR